MTQLVPGPRISTRVLLALFLTLIAATACRESSERTDASTKPAAPSPTPPSARASGSPARSASPGPSTSTRRKLPAAVSNDPYHPDIAPARFTTKIDNPYFPLIPGTTYTFQGVSAGFPETDIVTVTHQTKAIIGVRCVVVRDEVHTSGQLTELTFDWYAQDEDGNVWYFGEDSHEYSGGSPVSAFGSWEAGVDGAQPGIVMPGTPVNGQTYRQEYRRGQAEDMAQILRLNDRAKVPYDSFHSVVVTKDWSPLEPGIVEQKYYASGVGLVLESLVRGGDDVSRLVSVHR
jgi:hypothetical protein